MITKKIILIALCLVFFAGGIFIIKLPVPYVAEKCKTKKTPKKVAFKEYRLKNIKYYEKQILGKLLPEEEKAKNQSSEDIKDLKLMGVAIIGNEKSAVLLLTKEKKCITVKEKGKIGSYTLKKIDTNSVILAQNGKEHKLTISQESDISCSSARYTPSSTSQQVKIIAAAGSTRTAPSSQRKTKAKATQKRTTSKKTTRILKRKKFPSKRVPLFFQRKSSSQQSGFTPNPFLEILRRKR